MSDEDTKRKTDGKASQNREDTTIVFTDIRQALASADREVADKPAAIIAVGGELNGTIFDLFDGEITLGRSADNTIPLDFEGISRRHLKISVCDDLATVEDIGSRNGTFLNNQKIVRPIQLGKHDIIKVGSLAFKYLPKADPERLTYDKLNYEANTDQLTGCFNKAYFNNSIDIEVKKCKVTGSPLSLVMFDLDHFKKLNDNYGHDAGDFVLKHVSSLIRSEGVRDQDIFARYGGEEFVIILPGTNIRQAFEIAERVRKLIETYNFVYEEKKLPVAVSIGVADYRQGVENGVDLFKRADQALYQSKEGGRNQVNFYKSS